MYKSSVTIRNKTITYVFVMIVCIFLRGLIVPPEIDAGYYYSDIILGWSEWNEFPQLLDLLSITIAVISTLCGLFAALYIVRLHKDAYVQIAVFIYATIFMIGLFFVADFILWTKGFNVYMPIVDRGSIHYLMKYAPNNHIDELMAKMLSHKDGRFQEHAMRIAVSRTEYGDRRYLSYINKIAFSNNLPNEIREYAVNCLKKVGDTNSIQALELLERKTSP